MVREHGLYKNLLRPTLFDSKLLLCVLYSVEKKEYSSFGAWLVNCFLQIFSIPIKFFLNVFITDICYSNSVRADLSSVCNFDCRFQFLYNDTHLDLKWLYFPSSFSLLNI